MGDETWFIGSRRRYRTPRPGEGRAGGVERLDPAEFRDDPRGTAADEARQRDYELEVLERVRQRMRGD